MFSLRFVTVFTNLSTVWDVVEISSETRGGSCEILGFLLGRATWEAGDWSRSVWIYRKWLSNICKYGFQNMSDLGDFILNNAGLVVRRERMWPAASRAVTTHYTYNELKVKGQWHEFKTISASFSKKVLQNKWINSSWHFMPFAPIFL